MDFSKYDKHLQELDKKHRDYIRESDKRVIKVLKQMLDYAIELDDLELIGYTYHSMAFAEQFILGKYSSFLKHLRLSAKYLLRSGSDSELVHVYYLIAIDAMNKGLYDIAHHYFVEARNSAQIANDETSMAILDESIAHILMSIGYYQEASIHNKKSLKGLAKDKSHPHYYSNLLSCYMNDAILNIELNKYEQAIKSMAKVETFFKKNPEINKGRIKLYYELVLIRILVLTGKNKQAEDLFPVLIDTIESNQQTYLYMDELQKICTILLSKHKEQWTKQIIDALIKNPIPKDAVEAWRMAIEIEIDYYQYINDNEKLIETYVKQDKFYKMYLELQIHINQYVLGLVQLTHELRKEREAMLEEKQRFTLMAQIDELTAIPNRYAITLYLDEVFEQCYADKKPLGVVYLDLDDMKLINDTEGHLAGDKTLKEIGSVLLRHGKANDFFAGRFGGDEFVLIFRNKTAKAIQDILKDIQNDTEIVFSAGVYVDTPKGKQKSWEYLSGADERLYQIKTKKNEKKYKINSLIGKKNNSKIVKDYLFITNEIRMLSSLQVQAVKNADEYQKALLDNFAYIADLRKEKIEIVKNYLLPIMYSDKPLKTQEKDLLIVLSRSLLDAYSMENIELPVRYHINKRLLEDAKARGNLKEIILAQDAMIETVFGMMYMAQRLSPSANLCYEYRDEGLEIANELLEYLPKNKFKQLPDEECKQLVLINARYISALLDRSDNYNAEINKKDLQMMKDALALKDDEFYRKQVPNYNWRYHEFRTLQYINHFTELNNVRGFNKKELNEIKKYTEQFRELVDSDKEYFDEFFKEGMLELAEARIRFLCEDITIEEYINALKKIISSGDLNNYSLHENTIILRTFAEYLNIIKKHGYEKEIDFINHTYHNLVTYVQRMPKIGSLSFMLTFLSDILREYIDTDEDNDFEDEALKLMAAIHPSTYVHSLSVADISVCLTRHLIEKQPERFIGFLDCQNSKDVKAKKKEIFNFVEHAALIHDLGKLFIIETIITYGRDLLEEEYKLIRFHPQAGALLLEKHDVTKPYANIARYHHVWFNGTRGYPEAADIASLKEKVIIDIVAVADCLDAATDAIGRSFKKGITLDDFIEEIKADRGTRYAPYVVDLFSDDNVIKDIKEILNHGRNENYNKVYKMLVKEDKYFKD